MSKNYSDHEGPLDPQTLTDEDVIAAMKQISGYLDITPQDFKELYVVAYEHAIKRLLSTPVREIMTSPAFFVHDDLPVLEVARYMAQTKVSGIPVLNKNKDIVGVISEKDFMHGMSQGEQSFMGVVAACMVNKGCPAVTIKGYVAGEIMSSPAITVEQEDPVYDIYELMQKKNINRIPVTDKNHLVGIVSRDDTVNILAQTSQNLCKK